MWVFTASEERAAIVETASYNQKLLALRARRLAQQRMDHSYFAAIQSAKLNTLRDLRQASNYTSMNNIQNKRKYNKNANLAYLGYPPHLVSISDDEERDLNEVSAPVPNQKAYWTRKSKKNHRSKQKHMLSHSQSQLKTKASIDYAGSHGNSYQMSDVNHHLHGSQAKNSAHAISAQAKINEQRKSVSLLASNAKGKQNTDNENIVPPLME